MRRVVAGYPRRRPRQPTQKNFSQVRYRRVLTNPNYGGRVGYVVSRQSKNPPEDRKQRALNG